jgi:hypothetical protein
VLLGLTLLGGLDWYWAAPTASCATRRTRARGPGRNAVGDPGAALPEARDDGEHRQGAQARLRGYATADRAEVVLRASGYAARAVGRGFRPTWRELSGAESRPGPRVERVGFSRAPRRRARVAGRRDRRGRRCARRGHASLRRAAPLPENGEYLVRRASRCWRAGGRRASANALASPSCACGSRCSRPSSSSTRTTGSATCWRTPSSRLAPRERRRGNEADKVADGRMGARGSPPRTTLALGRARAAARGARRGAPDARRPRPAARAGPPGEYGSTARGTRRRWTRGC